MTRVPKSGTLPLLMLLLFSDAAAAEPEDENDENAGGIAPAPGATLLPDPRKCGDEKAEAEAAAVAAAIATGLLLEASEFMLR